MVVVQIMDVLDSWMGINPTEVVQAIGEIQDGEDIQLDIDSPGGLYFGGSCHRERFGKT